MHKIFITGASGYVGAMLVKEFAERTDVVAILALDKEPPSDLYKNNQKVTFIQANTSDESWVAEVRAFSPDIVIHTAWQIREIYGKKDLQWKWNVTGSDAIFNIAFSLPSVRKLIHFSTVASYAAYPTNEIEHLFTEEEPFRKSDYLYAEEKRIVEEHLKEKYTNARAVGGALQVAVIRPAAITGPRGRYMRIRFGLQAALSGQLKESFIHRLISAMVSFVPITKKWCRQFIHEDDIVDIVKLLSFNPLKNDFDIFNACPSGPVVRGKDMAEAVGKRTLAVHPWLIRIVFFVMWNISRGKVPTSKGGWKSYSYPIAVDGSKISKMYGFKYSCEAKVAFKEIRGRYAKYVTINSK